MTFIEVTDLLRAEAAGARVPHDKKYEQGAAFIDGRYCAMDEARIPLFETGFIHSDVVYEKATLSKGRLFRLEDHFDRFARSCDAFRLRNPHTNDQIRDILARLIRLSGFKHAGVFWCVTRGLVTAAASDRNKPDAAPTRFYATVNGYSSIATHEQRKRGLNLMISKRYIRIPPKAVDPKAKNFHWMDMKLSLFEAQDHGKDWSVLTDGEGYLTEAPGANIFLIKDGQLFTPDSGCLQGITRKSALELAAIIGISARVERVHADQLREADDAFLTSTGGGIMLVNSVDGIVLGGVDGPGKLAIRLHNLYWEKMWEGWKGTPVDYEGIGCP